jgi:hypothetical protein
MNSSTVGINVFSIHSSTTNSVVPIPAGLQHLKVELTETILDGCTFQVICGD